MAGSMRPVCRSRDELLFACQDADGERSAPPADTSTGRTGGHDALLSHHPGLQPGARLAGRIGATRTVRSGELAIARTPR